MDPPLLLSPPFRGQFVPDVTKRRAQPEIYRRPFGSYHHGRLSFLPFLLSSRSAFCHFRACPGGGPRLVPPLDDGPGSSSPPCLVPARRAGPRLARFGVHRDRGPWQLQPLPKTPPPFRSPGRGARPLWPLLGPRCGSPFWLAGNRPASLRFAFFSARRRKLAGGGDLRGRLTGTAKIG